MINIKTVSVIQIVLLVLSMIIAILHWISSSAAGGLNGVKYLIPISKSYQYLACIIVIGIVLKFLVLRSDFTLPVLGIIVVICFVVIHWVFYKMSGMFSLTGYDWIYYLTIIILLANSVLYLVLAARSINY